MKSKRHKKCKKLAVTQQHLASMVKNQHDHQKLIAKFHGLNKQKGDVQRKLSGIKVDLPTQREYEKKLEKLDELLNELGGLVVYQKASIVGEKKFNTSRYFLYSMEEVLKPLTVQLGRPLQLLDVGALGANYTKERSWLHTTAIDLHPTCVFVKKADFFKIPLPNPLREISFNPEISIPQGGFDVISLSLVINFVGDPNQRGDMIKKAYHLIQSHLQVSFDNTLTSSANTGFGGFLYVVIPRSCILNSRYLDQNHYLDLFQICGFQLITSKYSSKLAFHIFRRQTTTPQITKEAIRRPKKQIRDGPSLNNFTIVV